MLSNCIELSQDLAVRANTGTPAAAAQVACATFAWPPPAVPGGNALREAVEPVGASGRVTVLLQVGTGAEISKSFTDADPVAVESLPSRLGVVAPYLGLVDVDVPLESPSIRGGAVDELEKLVPVSPSFAKSSARRLADTATPPPLLLPLLNGGEGARGEQRAGPAVPAAAIGKAVSGAVGLQRGCAGSSCCGTTAALQSDVACSVRADALTPGLRRLRWSADAASRPSQAIRERRSSSESAALTTSQSSPWFALSKEAASIAGTQAPSVPLAGKCSSLALWQPPPDAASGWAGEELLEDKSPPAAGD